jgi:hypothetical protein
MSELSHTLQVPQNESRRQSVCLLNKIEFSFQLPLPKLDISPFEWPNIPPCLREATNHLAIHSQSHSADIAALKQYVQDVYHKLTQTQQRQHSELQAAHAALGLRVYETDAKIDTVSKALQKQQDETDECCKRTTRGLLTNIQEL